MDIPAVTVDFQAQAGAIEHQNCSSQQKKKARAPQLSPHSKAQVSQIDAEVSQLDSKAGIIAAPVPECCGPHCHSRQRPAAAANKGRFQVPIANQTSQRMHSRRYPRANVCELR